MACSPRRRPDVENDGPRAEILIGDPSDDSATIILAIRRDDDGLYSVDMIDGHTGESKRCRRSKSLEDVVNRSARAIYVTLCGLLHEAFDPISTGREE